VPVLSALSFQLVLSAIIEEVLLYHPKASGEPTSRIASEQAARSEKIQQHRPVVRSKRLECDWDPAAEAPSGGLFTSWDMDVHYGL
jgi:hypothetical protein